MKTETQKIIAQLEKISKELAVKAYYKETQVESSALYDASQYVDMSIRRLRKLED